MKNRLIIPLTVICLSILPSCLKDLLCVNGDGIIETEKRRVTSFDKIDNSTSFEVIYKKADTLGISITAEQNILGYIETNVYDNSLEISTSPGSICLDYSEQPVITVTSPLLKMVKLSGSGDLFADTMASQNVTLISSGSGNISVDQLISDESQITVSGSGSINISKIICLNSDILITGSGNVSLSGNGENSHLRITGSGNIYSGNFPVKSSSVIISGSGDAYTNIEQYLNGLISGSGNIYVKGDPEIDQTVSGSGRIIKH